MFQNMIKTTTSSSNNQQQVDINNALTNNTTSNSTNTNNDTNLHLLQMTQILSDFQTNFNSSSIPPGLIQPLDLLNEIYPNLEKSILIKTENPFIYGGTDPLDYIYVFRNNNNRESIPHWHYVGFGLSDINNYKILCESDELFRKNNPIYAQTVKPFEIIYPPSSSAFKGLNGYGFEFTFRLKCNSLDELEKNEPPKWPCKIMQLLAKYVFQSKNIFSVGDHLDWQRPLSSKCNNINGNLKDDDDDEDDDDYDDDSIIKHMLMTLDPQLKTIQTSSGLIKFIQIVGVTQDELNAAREWNVEGILELLKQNIEIGGELLITDMKRGASIFESNPEYRDDVDDGIKKMGSCLSILNVNHDYSSRILENNQTVTENNNFNNNQLVNNNNNNNNLENDDDVQMRCSSRMSCKSQSSLLIENAENAQTRFYHQICLILPLNAAKLLTVALEGRLAHKKNFSFKTLNGDLCTTLIPEGYNPTDCLASSERPYVRQGCWLHIFISEQLRYSILEKIKDVFNRDVDDESLILPKNYSWEDHKFYITVVRDEKEIK